VATARTGRVETVVVIGIISIGVEIGVEIDRELKSGVDISIF
jgi:hypothetical protein